MVMRERLVAVGGSNRGGTQGMQAGSVKRREGWVGKGGLSLAKGLRQESGIRKNKLEEAEILKKKSLIRGVLTGERN